jgi:hypothetical protein
VFEWIPLSLGVAAGAVATRLGSTRARAAFLAVAALLTAVIAGVVSGELQESWGFLLFDGGQALCAGAATIAVLSARRRGRERLS